MSFIMKELIKGKIRQLTIDELLHYAGDYGFSISEKEAATILHYIQNQDFDLFSKQSVAAVYRKIAEVTDVQTAEKAKDLFEQIIQSYGLEDYFN